MDQARIVCGALADMVGVGLSNSILHVPGAERNRGRHILIVEGSNLRVVPCLPVP